MEEYNIPESAFDAEIKWKRPNPRGKKGLVRDFVFKRLLEGRLTDKEIAEEAAVLFDGSTSVKAVQWYKFQFRKEGKLPSNLKHRHKRRFLTKFTYEVIALQVPPPDNVAVLDSEALIYMAREVLRKYARIIPKPLDEIIYDVRTAKHTLEKSGRYQVIDQNNYDDPFTLVEYDDEEDDIDEEQ